MRPEIRGTDLSITNLTASDPADPPGEWRGLACLARSCLIHDSRLVQLFASVAGGFCFMTRELLQDPARVLCCQLLPMVQGKMPVCSGSSASGVRLDSGITLP